MECLQYSKEDVEAELDRLSSFKPCYKWNAFNTVAHDSLLNYIQF